MQKNETILQEVQFDPKVKLYWYLQGIWVHALLVLAVIGCVSLPAWILGGWWLVARRFETMSATLTNSSIHLSKGYINRVEKTIPLEKIQDLGMRTGPLLNMFGLASIQIETAGSSAQQSSDMVLAGVVDPTRFRNAVLEQRELVSGRGAVAAGDGASTLSVLTEIRDSLSRIEGLLAKE
jgi:uncharacterized membrane protein YdbT with pleckstrin-like domain